jgi:hypothetical protein
MCDAQPERMGLLYPGLVSEESSFERIIKRDLPRTFPKVEMVPFFLSNMSSLKIQKALDRRCFSTF